MKKILRFMILTLLYVGCSMFLFVIPATITSIFGASWYVVITDTFYITIFGIGSLIMTGFQFDSAFDENYYSNHL